MLLVLKGSYRESNSALTIKEFSCKLYASIRPDVRRKHRQMSRTGELYIFTRHSQSRPGCVQLWWTGRYASHTCLSCEDYSTGSSVIVSHSCRYILTMKPELKSDFRGVRTSHLSEQIHTVKFTSQTPPVMSRTGCCIRHCHRAVPLSVWECVRS